MKQARTTPELILAISRAMLLLGWAVFVIMAVATVVDAEGYSEGAWLDGLLTLVVAGVGTIGVLWSGRSKRRRALTRPSPDRGLGGWFWRQPGWRLALIVWALELIPVGGLVVALMRAGYGPDSASLFARSFAILGVGSVLTAVSQAASWCVVRERRSALRMAGVGRASHGGPPKPD